MPQHLPRLLIAATALCLALAAARADDLKDIERLYRDGQTEQALRRADEVIAARPRAADVRFFKGVMLGELKRSGEAIQTYRRLTEDFPELSDPYNNLAVLYAAQGDLAPALEALQIALRNDGTNLAARENLGDVYLALAVQAWSVAASQSKGSEAALQRKLRLAREIQPAARAASAPRPPG